MSNQRIGRSWQNRQMISATRIWVFCGDESSHHDYRVYCSAYIGISLAGIYEQSVSGAMIAVWNDIFCDVYGIVNYPIASAIVLEDGAAQHRIDSC